MSVVLTKDHLLEREFPDVFEADNGIQISNSSHGLASLDNRITHLFVKFFHSYQQGSGKALFERIIRLSFACHMEGDIRLDAAYRSHIFYLRMGMVPAIKYESDFRADFATRLLDIIERTAEVGKRVNTTDLGRQYMVMSDVGKKRWETAITSGDCFEQFRDFSQLKPFMNEAQWKRLQQILP